MDKGLVYYNARHPAGFGSIKQLIKATKDPNSLKWLQGQRTYTLHKQRRKRMPTYRRYRSSYAGYQFQADLNDLSIFVKQNKNYKYLLTVIDIFSRFAYAQPLKTKTGIEITQAFKKIFKHMKPLFLQTDDGTEFLNRIFQAYLKAQGVHHFSVKGDLKACIVERFNRTLKTRMFKYFTYKNTRNWVNVLEDLVYSYNNRVHSSLPNKLTPTEALHKENEYDVWEHQLTKKQGRRKEKIKFKVGDTVRLSTAKQPFKKGYLPQWTEELFTVDVVDTRANPPLYTVKDYKDEKIHGKFYAEELQKAHTEYYPIEKIYKRRTNKYLVKFVGYPEKYWVSSINKQ